MPRCVGSRARGSGSRRTFCRGAGVVYDEFHFRGFAREREEKVLPCPGFPRRLWGREARYGRPSTRTRPVLLSYVKEREEWMVMRGVKFRPAIIAMIASARGVGASCSRSRPQSTKSSACVLAAPWMTASALTAELSGKTQNAFRYVFGSGPFSEAWTSTSNSPSLLASRPSKK